jgi:hypothetical protein
MNAMILSECKAFVTAGDLSGLQEYYSEIQTAEFSYSISWQYIYQKVYLHACLKKKVDIAEWLTSIFPTFDSVSQIAMRQMFPYGRHLLAR